jgi:alpha-galactosidase
MKTLLATSLALLLLLVATPFSQNKQDISGTWVAQRQLPNGDVAELIYEIKVADGKITGYQRLPFGDAFIVDGKVDGDQVELTLDVDAPGGPQRRVVKGTIVGDELRVTPALPGPPPGATPPAGATPPPAATPPAATPGAAPAAPPGGPGGAARALFSGEMALKRGTPTPTYRAAPVNFATLPKVELPAAHAVKDNGLAKRPPMGWNSWNKFRTRFDDKTVREIADAMVASGMKDAGYQYINIDDGWQGKRDEKGVLQANPNFPDMKALADYVHSKGLKLGIYSSPGPLTCARYEGSYGREDLDAKTWAAWGIDYLKYDWCSAGRVWKDEDMVPVYQRMGDALLKTGRPIVFSLCQYGRAKVQEWGPNVGGNLWRTTGDIRDQWESMLRIAAMQHELQPFAKPGHWNDPDMLEIGNGAMSTAEYQVHFSMWAMLAAPLIAGNDLRNMTPEIKEILTNKDVIAVDQDELGQAGARVGPAAATSTALKSASNLNAAIAAGAGAAGGTEVWLRQLAKGAHAIALFNLGSTPAEMSVKWADLKLKGPLTVRDLWAHADRGRQAEGYTATVPAHGVVMIRVSK